MAILFATLFIATAATATEYHVDVTTGSDKNPGSADFPLKTISAAVTKVSAGDTIWIHPGTYREMFEMTKSGSDADHPISIRATEPSKVDIKGSDAVTGWVLHSGKIWKKTGWQVNSQQVFADGLPLTQIGYNSPYNSLYFAGQKMLPSQGSGVSSMKAGSFYFDFWRKALYVWLPDGSDPNRHAMEASARTTIIKMHGLDYINLEGLNFSHSNVTASIDMSAMVNIAGNYWTISNCSFTYGDFAGLGILGKGHRISNCIADFNGDVGISVNGSDTSNLMGTSPADIVFENNQTNNNNYRKFATIWHAGGMKMGASSAITVTKHTALSNYGPGIWCDGGSKDVTITASVMKNNLLGIFYEISDDAIISDNVVTDNSNYGIFVSASSGVSVLNNSLVNNGYGVVLHGMPRQEHPSLSNNTIMNNRISRSQLADLIIYHASSGTTGNVSDYNTFSSLSDATIQPPILNTNIIKSTSLGGGLMSFFNVPVVNNTAASPCSVRNVKISWTKNSNYTINYVNLGCFADATGYDIHSTFDNDTGSDESLSKVP
ncbi:MAG: right-handed parallel beta-helix repeat-containing protein [Smithellaceae bacterium]|nr:right-handed parallel beta-helix repeat-containing protein [Smithellaceae bacterium]